MQRQAQGWHTYDDRPMQRDGADIRVLTPIVWLGDCRTPQDAVLPLRHMHTVSKVRAWRQAAEVDDATRN